MKRLAAIDVGSNALRLRIVELDAVDTPGSRRQITEQRAAVRLGSPVFDSGELSPKAIAQAVAALRDFKKTMDAARIDAYRAVATSAVREASNREILVERARREAGIELEVIEGVEEARLIQLAVRHRLPLAGRTALLVDVGGGSTELTYLDDEHVKFSESLPLGSVRSLEFGELSEKKARDLLEEHVGRSIDAAIGRLNERLKRPKKEGKPPPVQLLIATGGNSEALADLCSAGGTERAAAVDKLQALYQRLVKMKVDERIRTFQLRPDRADTIVPASAIFLRVAKAVLAKDLQVPGAGLKDGLIEDLVERYLRPVATNQLRDIVLESCVRLGEKYGFDEPHAKQVAKLSETLFHDLATLHRLGPRDLLLLQAAAYLHDIGDFVRNEGHHKHSYYLILHSDLMGLTREDRTIVANIARYHRKSLPDKTHPNFRDLDSAARERVRALAAILRIADGLDRDHAARVTGVTAKIDETAARLVLTAQGTEEHGLERWSALGKADLFREVYGLDVAMDEDEV